MMRGWIRTQDEISKVVSICKECPSKNGGRCGECGCFLSMIIKIKKYHCPLSKW